MTPRATGVFGRTAGCAWLAGEASPNNASPALPPLWIKTARANCGFARVGFKQELTCPSLFCPVLFAALSAKTLKRASNGAVPQTPFSM
jgi:hypothetical protein